MYIQSGFDSELGASSACFVHRVFSTTLYYQAIRGEVGICTSGREKYKEGHSNCTEKWH
jgi:hypothetical protein